MASKPSVPQTPSKIPKLVAPPSTLSPRGRTPSFIMSEAPAPTVSPLKVKRGLSSPRQPISFRIQGTPSTPVSPRLTHQQSSIKSKSHDETTRHAGSVEQIDALPDTVEDDPAITLQGGEGDMPSPLAIRADPSEMKVKSKIFSLKAMESRLACNSADVDVLYANPIRMDSIVSVSTPTPQQKRSTTYLDIYEKESFETIQALGSVQNVSLEWDFATGVEGSHESYTQTSAGILVDRASSVMALPSFSKESLLDQQTTPLSVLDALTTEEEGEEVSDEMSTYAYDCFAREVEGEEEKYEFSPLITTAPVEEEEEEEAVVKIELKEKFQSQFTPRCCLDEVRHQETSQTYESDDDMEVKEVFSLEIPKDSERTSSLPDQRSSHPSHQVIVPEIAQSSASFPRQRSTRPSQQDIAPQIAQSSASFPRQRSTRPSQQDIAPQIAQSSASFPRQRSTRPSQQDITPEITQSSASIPHQRKSSKIPLPEWQVENLKPKLSISASGGAIEIQPPPVQLSPDDLMDLNWRHEEQRRLSETQEVDESRESNSIFSAVQSRIILEQSSANFGKGMRGSLEICNSTSFPQGFKLVCNHATKKDLKFTPEIGLIPPHGKVTVNVSSFNSSVLTQYDASNYWVWVHMFRAFCKDEHELKEFYSKLERQHPELIQTSTISNFIIWNNDDLPGMLEMINSVHDELEREALMGEIHRHQSSHSIVNETTMDRLENLQITMVRSNSALKKVGMDLSDIRNGVQLFLFMALMIYAMTYLLPYMHEIPSPLEATPVAPEAKPEDCLLCPSSWMPSWDEMHRGMNDRIKNTYEHIMSYF